MNFDLTKPCKNCPFRNDIKGYLTKQRAREISNGLLNDSTFTCHKTNKFNNGETMQTSKSQHCAGAMIILEKLEKPNQMMRIMERLGGYDYKKLKMDSPVFNNFKEFIKAQEGK